MNPVKASIVFKQITTNLKCQYFWLKEIFSKNRIDQSEEKLRDMDKEYNGHHI